MEKLIKREKNTEEENSKKNKIKKLRNELNIMNIKK